MLQNLQFQEDVTGIVHLNFRNLDDNNLARATIPIVINPVTNTNSSVLIPDWLKNNALWWSQNEIDDNMFLQGIEYLIKNESITISQTKQTTSAVQEIPDWLKNNAGQWADNKIDDEKFAGGLKFLVENGFIHP